MNDAWVSGDGFSGHVRDASPNQTKTIFAGPNILALDWVMGEKMGLNPATNYVIQEALLHWEKPAIERAGDISPWSPWVNVKQMTVSMLDMGEEATTSAASCPAPLPTPRTNASHRSKKGSGYSAPYNG